MRLSIVLALSALVAVSSAFRQSQYQPTPPGINSNRCNIFKSINRHDFELKECMLTPWDKIWDLLNIKNLQNHKALQTIFTKLCTPTPCPQALIEDLAVKAAKHCTANDQEWQFIHLFGNMYTPLMKAFCYRDVDKEFVVVKDILRFELNMNKGGPSFDFFGMPVWQLEWELPFKNDICTKGNQHVVGTILAFVKASPVLSAYAANKWDAKWEEMVMQAITDNCGAKYANGLAFATGPPYPEVQQPSDSSLGNDTTREGMDTTRKGKVTTHKDKDATRKDKDTAQKASDGDTMLGKETTLENKDTTQKASDSDSVLGSDATREGKDTTREGKDTTHEGKDTTLEGKDTTQKASHSDSVLGNNASGGKDTTREGEGKDTTQKGNHATRASLSSALPVLLSVTAFATRF